MSRMGSIVGSALIACCVVGCAVTESDGQSTSSSAGVSPESAARAPAAGRCGELQSKALEDAARFRCE